MSISRRSFFASSAVAVAAVGCPRMGHAQNAQLVQESDPAAKANSFHSDASTVDKAKFPQYTPDQLCSACSFYESTGATEGACSLYGGKHVPSKAWCAAFFKRV
jgi:hypothetical protein